MPEPSSKGREAWTAIANEPDHPLSALDGRAVSGGRLRVYLGRRSRFGARYFRLLLETTAGVLTQEPVLTGLHHSGPLPTYNWVEVAETRHAPALPDGSEVDVGPDGVEELWRLLYELLPEGGHLMVEYDSAARSDTADALAHNVPAIATPLGESLFWVGFGARFKDWQIAEGGSEGPRKLQAYRAPAGDHAARWRGQAKEELRRFLARPEDATSPAVKAARTRAEALLEEL